MSGTSFDRKELKQPDAFQRTTSDFAQKLSNNKIVLFALLVLLILVGIGVQAYQSRLADKKQDAENAIYAASKNLETKLEQVSKTDSAWESKIADEIAALEKAADANTFDEVSAGHAYMQIGAVYAQRNQYENALKFYMKAEKLLTSEAKVLKMIALSSTAYAFENLKQYDPAIERHNQIASSEIKPLQEDSMLSLGRLYTLKGDKAKARETYQKFIQTYPTSTSVKKAEALMSALQ